jgi:cardiolipin synthase
VGGSSSRAAAGALRIANTMGAALTDRRVLGDTETGTLLSVTLLFAALTVIAVLWPAVIAWPLAVIAAWFAINTGVRAWRWRKRHARRLREMREYDDM